MNRYVLCIIILCLNVGTAFSHIYGPTVPTECIEDASFLQKKQSVIELVDSYQALALKKFNSKIDLKFSKACKLQAAVRFEENKAELTVYSGIINQMNSGSILTTVCHELGHLFGDVPGGLIGAPWYDDKMISVEGEADYFAGKCTRKYLEKTNGSFSTNSQSSAVDIKYCQTSSRECLEALTAVRNTFKTLYNGAVMNEALVRGQEYSSYKGINPEYPDPYCRLFSAISGVLEQDRPKCWYNPDKN